MAAITNRRRNKSGIGTYTIPQIVSPFWSKVTKTIDMMVGNHLDAHVMGTHAVSYPIISAIEHAFLGM